MGTLRKMGAFLGLVPDESRQYGEQDYDADHGYDAEYSSDPYATDERSTEYGTAAYAGDRHDAADDRAGYDGAGYAEAGYDVDDRSDGYPGDPAYAPAAGYAGDDQPTREYAYAGAEPSMRPTAGRSAGRGRGRDTGDDFQTHGALAVQASPRMEAVATDPGGAAKPVTVKLDGFADARQVGETYRDGVAVILDMTDLTDAEARRMVDFAAGLAFAVRGSIDKVTTKVFMLHPPTADADH